jgi:hypothetical protein
VSFITQGIALFLVAAFIRSSELSTGDKAINLGIATASMVFVFLWFFTMSNIVPCWIYVLELQLRGSATDPTDALRILRILRILYGSLDPLAEARSSAGRQQYYQNKDI